MHSLLFAFSLFAVALCHPYTNYQSPQQQNKVFLTLDTPEVFASTPSPLLNPHKSSAYTDFLSELYRFDKDKDPQTFLVQHHAPAPPPPQQQNLYHTQQRYEQPPPYLHQQHAYPQSNPIYNNPHYVQGDIPSSPDHSISKRALIFRPLFVYRKQTVKRQELMNQQRDKNNQRHPQPTPQATPPPRIPQRKPSPSLYSPSQYYGQNYPYSN